MHRSYDKQPLTGSIPGAKFFLHWNPVCAEKRRLSVIFMTSSDEAASQPCTFFIFSGFLEVENLARFLLFAPLR